MIWGTSDIHLCFFHKMDLQKVVEGGPWSFEQSMLVLYQLKENEDPHNIRLQELEIWVQVYDVPRGCLSENILKNVGMALGRYIKMEPLNLGGTWKQYLRIRVAMNVEKPLKRRMKLKRDGGNWSWINFKYERLGTFCFVCGILGHSERDCNIVYANSDKVVEKAYGSWLRAPSRNVKNNTGSRWLRTAGDGENPWSSAANNGGQSSTAREEKVNTRNSWRLKESYAKSMEIMGQSRYNRETIWSGKRGLLNSQLLFKIRS